MPVLSHLADEVVLTAALRHFHPHFPALHRRHAPAAARSRPPCLVLPSPEKLSAKGAAKADGVRLFTPPSMARRLRTPPRVIGLSLRLRLEAHRGRVAAAIAPLYPLAWTPGAPAANARATAAA